MIVLVVKRINAESYDKKLFLFLRLKTDFFFCCFAW